MLKCQELFCAHMRIYSFDPSSDTWLWLWLTLELQCKMQKECWLQHSQDALTTKMQCTKMFLCKFLINTNTHKCSVEGTFSTGKTAEHKSPKLSNRKTITSPSANLTVTVWFFFCSYITSGWCFDAVLVLLEKFLFLQTEKSYLINPDIKINLPQNEVIPQVWQSTSLNGDWNVLERQKADGHR